MAIQEILKNQLGSSFYEYSSSLQSVKFSLKDALIISTCLFSIRFIAVSIYRLYFHPLRHIPGPFLAKISSAYEIYYEVILGGQLTFHVCDSLHPKYGPVVRISPNRIRCNDPEAWHKIHTYGTSAPTREPSFYYSCRSERSVIGMWDHAAHKERRSLLSPYFTMTEIINHHVPHVQQKLAWTTKFLREHARRPDRERRLVCLSYAVIATLTDVWGELIAGYDFQNITPNFDHILTKACASYGMPTFRHLLPRLHRFLLGIPPWVLTPFNPIIAGVASLQQTLLDRAIEIKSSMHSEEKQKSGRVSMLEHMLESSPSSKPDLWAEEAFILFGAAVVDSASIPPVAIYQIIRHPEVKRRLLEELDNAFPDKDAELDYNVLVKLPYLNAVLKECLRYHPPVPGILPRLPPKGGMELCGYHIPEGTIIDTTAWAIHRNSSVFPRPHKFIPDRWLPEFPLHGSLQPKSLDRYLAAFGGGQHTCLGKNMAMAEAYIITATLLRRFDFKPSEALEREGWTWTDMWFAVKTGDEGNFYIGERRS